MRKATLKPTNELSAMAESAQRFEKGHLLLSWDAVDAAALLLLLPRGSPVRSAPSLCAQRIARAVSMPGNEIRPLDLLARLLAFWQERRLRGGWIQTMGLPFDACDLNKVQERECGRGGMRALQGSASERG